MQASRKSAMLYGSVHSREKACRRRSERDHKMKGALLELAGWQDSRLFDQIGAGIPLIAKNADSLDESARRLCLAGEIRASKIIQGFAEEEAAKVLILLDAVRCPTVRRLGTLKCFYSHLAKRIYALSSSFPNILTFRELGDLVAHERQPYYLDGPNSVDWIFTNSITTERERTIYVDCVRDITETSGGYGWSAPEELGIHFNEYRQPESVKLSRAFCDAGANSGGGLAVIADTWNGFLPTQDTSREELRGVIAQMLNALAEGGHCTASKAAQSQIVTNWSFPLWPFDLHQKPLGKTVDELREQRRQTIKWIEKTEAQRDPPPAIDRVKVEMVSRAYAEWEEECDRDDRRKGRGTYGTSRIRSSSEFSDHLELPSYKRLESMLRDLTEKERAALLALAWFTRNTLAN